MTVFGSRSRLTWYVTLPTLNPFAFRIFSASVNVFSVTAGTACRSAVFPWLTITLIAEPERTRASAWISWAMTVFSNKLSEG